MNLSQKNSREWAGGQLRQRGDTALVEQREYPVHCGGRFVHPHVSFQLVRIRSVLCAIQASTFCCCWWWWWGLWWLFVSWYRRVRVRSFRVRVSDLLSLLLLFFCFPRVFGPFVDPAGRCAKPWYFYMRVQAFMFVLSRCAHLLVTKRTITTSPPPHASTEKYHMCGCRVRKCVRALANHTRDVPYPR